MKSLRGISRRIPSGGFARVETHRKSNHNSAYMIRFDQNATLGLIVCGDTPLSDCPNLQLPDDPCLNIGDILSFDESGDCTILYSANTDDNALLLTERCNSNCLSCPQPPKPSSPPSYLNDCIRTLNMIDTSPKILNITGGEPTLPFDDLLCLMEAIREKHPDCLIHLLTNGRSLNDYEKAKSITDIGGDKILFCVPVYSDDETVHDNFVQREGAFWQTVQGLHNIGRVMGAVEIRTVITHLNYQRLLPWSEYIYRTFPFAVHVAIMGLEPIGLGRENLSQLWIEPSEYGDQLVKSIRTFHRCGIPVSIYNHPLCLLPKTVWPFAKKSISSWKVLYTEGCKACTKLEACGGMFFSVMDMYRNNLVTIS